MKLNSTGMLLPDTAMELRSPRDSDRDASFTLQLGDDLFLFGSREEFTRLRDVLTAALGAEGPTAP